MNDVWKTETMQQLLAIILLSEEEDEDVWKIKIVLG